MVRNTFLLVAAFLISLTAYSQHSYRFSLDLRAVKNDKLKVTLLPPALKGETATYLFPKIVPGTYTVYDFGRFVTAFKAFDHAGKRLVTEKVGSNGWKIRNVSKLAKITYLVEDTWDAKKPNFVFEPAGTNIEKNEVFVLNNYGFFGYFSGKEELNYHVEVKKPKGFYGSTSMHATHRTDSSETYQMPNYRDLADAPILYTIPDTTHMTIGGADILVSVYSPNRTVSSEFISQNIRELLVAQKEFLGGRFPISNYAFLIFLTDKMEGSGYQGALEHSYSSLYFLPEISDDPSLQEELAQEIRDVASHEFFHILTPLNIHSTEIHEFDFNNPKMSKHLWLYEGVVEYFSGLMQVQKGLISEDDYLTVLEERMKGADDYRKDLSFTEMSAKCLDKHAEEYGNVYEKGALIGLSLDLLLLELSEGNYRLTDLMNDLAKRYGKDQPFKDGLLFSEIQQITGYKEVADFLRKHVAGTKELPLEELLKQVGYLYSKEKMEKRITMGNVALGINKNGQLVVRDTEGMNKFGEKLGYEVGDVIISINKQKIGSMEEAVSVLRKFRENAKPGKKFRVKVLRKNRKGTFKQKKLSARLVPEEVPILHVIDPVENPSEAQLKRRAIWLGKEPVPANP